MNNSQIFNIILEVLRHIKNVEIDVKERSLQTAKSFSSAISSGEIVPTNDVVCALQYQDIISQQLTATVEAIDAIDHSISVWLHAYQNDSSMLTDGLLRLDEKLKISLEEARKKKAAFSGREDTSQDEIEFF